MSGRRDVIDGLGEDSMIVFAPEDAKYTVSVFNAGTATASATPKPCPWPSAWACLPAAIRALEGTQP